MENPRTELNKFLKEYERATNTHDFENVKPLLLPEATYFFSDDTLNGLEEIEKAFEKTWQKIQDETYSIEGVRWITVTKKVGVCLYKFKWSGTVDGKRQSGEGRGTNVVVKRGGEWYMSHEHLSVPSN